MKRELEVFVATLRPLQPVLRPVPFQEDEWMGGVLSFGEGDDAPAITVTMRDVRCAMLTLIPTQRIRRQKC